MFEYFVDVGRVGFLSSLSLLLLLGSISGDGLLDGLLGSGCFSSGCFRSGCLSSGGSGFLFDIRQGIIIIVVSFERRDDCDELTLSATLGAMLNMSLE